ncbi:MAG: HD domain-containing protein [Candidatus Levybacteria bacterium]|nr:HD domain-containing protein [Candidatus Levybacteria bacterium]
MFTQIPHYVLNIIEKFQNRDFSIYLVGGCVRDLLLQRPVKDWDFTTNATPEEILTLFPDGFYDNIFGTVGIPLEVEGETKVLEVTTFRTEHGYKDRRHPEVRWGKTIDEDLERRDFTINAIALQLSSNHPSPLVGEGQGEGNFEIIDPFNGQTDLQNKIIRAVGDPDKRFKEDALRLMRAIRLATELSFTLEKQTLASISKDAPLITEIAGERIRDELMRILASEYPYEGIMLLRNTGLLEHILPELVEGIGVSQERPGRHHKTDVFTHNVLSLKFCPCSDPIVRFATLIHDIGKPQVASTDEEGYVIFHNHEIEGAKMAYHIAQRLRFSKKDRQKVVTLVRWHMFTVDEKATDAAVRRFIRRVGVENVEDIIDLRIGDRLGSGTQTAESWRLKLFKKRIEEQLAPAPFSINNLAIDGNDVMKELNLKPGPRIGEILQKLFEEVDEDLSKNTKEYLTQRLYELQR